jgi:predicted RNA binding protein YcfA (HicA-like mRNA interferase family)
LAALQKAGFYIHHQEGSHISLRARHDAKLRVVVPVNRKDLKRGTLKSIIEQAKLTVDDFIGLL